MYTPVRDYHLHQAEYDNAIKEVLEAGQFILGPQVKELEEKLAKRVNVKHCITMGSGTDALLAALLAYQVGNGDYVITTPFTWISTAEVISLLGATPIFIDIDPQSYNLDPVLLKLYLEDNQDKLEKIKAIIAVDLYGRMADYRMINQIASTYNIPVIEDAAQSFGAVNACAAADIGCTSFFPTKPLGCYGDGGACFTNSDDLAKRLREIRTHGGKKRERIGFNGRLDTIQAAILLVKLEHFDEAIATRVVNAEFYKSAFKDVDWLDIPNIPGHCYGQYTLRIKNNLRDSFKDHLESSGVACKVFYSTPLHHEVVFQGACETYPKNSLKIAEKACQEVISIPVYPELAMDEQIKIIKTVLEFIS